MRWFLLLAVLGLSVAQEASFAQRPPGAECPGSTRSASDEYRDTGYFAATGVVRFQLIQGRLQLDAPRHRKGSQNREAGDVYESITVTAARGIPSLHYVFQSPHHQLTLSVQHATHVRIESILPKTGERAVLDQPRNGPITFQIHQGDLNRSCSGTTLLHVRLDDPASFDLHCGRLIQQLLRGRSLKQLNDEISVAVLKQISKHEPTVVEEVRECVQKLRSPKLATRRKAEKQLLSWGVTILPIIDAINPDDLDAEQVDRLRHIRTKFRSREDDTARSLAMLLINDRDHWSRLAPRLNTDQLQLANHHLDRVGLKTIPVTGDPVERIARNPE